MLLGLPDLLAYPRLEARNLVSTTVIDIRNRRYRKYIVKTRYVFVLCRMMLIARFCQLSKIYFSQGACAADFDRQSSAYIAKFMSDEVFKNV